MPQPLKYFVRGYEGTFTKYGEDPQESQTGKGMKPSDQGYGVESPDIHGMLTTHKQFHPDQKRVTGWTGDKEMYHGKFPSLQGSYMDYYEDVVKAIRGEAEVVIKPELARDGLRIIELGRESADSGKTLRMDWADFYHWRFVATMGWWAKVTRTRRNKDEGPCSIRDERKWGETKPSHGTVEMIELEPRRPSEGVRNSGFGGLRHGQRSSLLLWLSDWWDKTNPSANLSDLRFVESSHNRTADELTMSDITSIASEAQITQDIAQSEAPLSTPRTLSGRSNGSITPQPHQHDPSTLDISSKLPSVDSPAIQEPRAASLQLRSVNSHVIRSGLTSEEVELRPLEVESIHDRVLPLGRTKKLLIGMATLMTTFVAVCLDYGVK